MIINKYSLLFLIVFEIIALTLWKNTNNIFYFYNFTYIGTFLAIGSTLFTTNNKYAKNITQIFIGSYMLIYLGLILKENMQIEGFWYYLFLGVFEAGVIHYVVAKIVGPLIFGRGWCGYACWTAMVLDALPYNKPFKLNKVYEKIRNTKYIVFIISFIFVSLLFILQVDNIENIMYIAFIVGNILYYITGIILAYKFKDNRAFCKYICPITIFLKPMSYFSIIRIKCDKSKCINCYKCKNICAMEVDMLDNSRKRKNGTECILCGECIKSCPANAL